MAKNNTIGEVMADVHADLKRRGDNDAEAAAAPVTFVLVHGIQRIKKLRYEEDFSFSLDADEEGGGRINILDEQGELLTSLMPFLVLGEVTEREWANYGPQRLPQNVTDAGKIIVEFEFISTESAEAKGGGLYIDDVIVK